MVGGVKGAFCLRFSIAIVKCRHEVQTKPAMVWVKGRMVDLLGYRCVCYGYDSVWL